MNSGLSLKPMPLPNPFFFLERPKPKRHGKLFIVPAVDFEDLPKAKTRFLIRVQSNNSAVESCKSEFLRGFAARVWYMLRVLDHMSFCTCKLNALHCEAFFGYLSN
ncbi:hypothetical protein V6N12_020813 [Hibiscus sabdariffa]|uniref:Uncharacterized protein n=1 Tax=Hibiscus sabdariffa TaxID=183260 RepID=A0ABR2CZ82_9ROSI